MPLNELKWSTLCYMYLTSKETDRPKVTQLRCLGPHPGHSELTSEAPNLRVHEQLALYLRGVTRILRLRGGWLVSSPGLAAMAVPAAEGGGAECGRLRAASPGPPAPSAWTSGTSLDTPEPRH